LGSSVRCINNGLGPSTPSVGLTDDHTLRFRTSDGRSVFSVGTPPPWSFDLGFGDPPFLFFPPVPFPPRWAATPVSCFSAAITNRARTDPFFDPARQRLTTSSLVLPSFFCCLLCRVLATQKMLGVPLVTPVWSKVSLLTALVTSPRRKSLDGASCNFFGLACPPFNRGRFVKPPPTRCLFPPLYFREFEGSSQGPHFSHSYRYSPPPRRIFIRRTPVPHLPRHVFELPGSMWPSPPGRESQFLYQRAHGGTLTDNTCAGLVPHLVSLRCFPSFTPLFLSLLQEVYRRRSAVRFPGFS